METTGRLLKQVKNYFQTLWYCFEDFVYENQIKTIIYALSGMVLVSLLTIAMIFANREIRSAQLFQMLYRDLPTEQILPLTYSQESAEINSKAAVSVMFSKPHGDSYSKALALLAEKEEELNRNFYFFPIVYQSSAIAKEFNLDVNEVTFIFFEEGEEKNRFTFDSLENPESTFIPELNRLPMWNIQTTQQD